MDRDQTHEAKKTKIEKTLWGKGIHFVKIEQVTSASFVEITAYPMETLF